MAKPGVTTEPVRPKERFLVFGQPDIRDDEIREVVASMTSGWLGTGPKVARFERDFGAYVGASHAVALNSCTAALHLSLLALGLSPERTMYDLMKAGPPFDHEKLDRHLIRHSSGVKVLIAPTRPDQASAVSIDFLRDIYASLRTMCDAVIVDTPPGFTPEVIATIDVSSEICMVGMLDSLSLKNTKLGLETLERRLADELRRADAVFLPPTVVGAWGRRSGGR
jgi:hypothetical protein